MLPCLLFTDMMLYLDVSQLKNFGICFLLATLHVIIGCSIGWILAHVTKAERDIRRLIMCSIGFQDTTAFPLVYAIVLGTSNVTKKDHDFQDKATEYVLIYTIFIVIYKWTVAYSLMGKKTNELAAFPLKNEVDQHGNKINLFWKLKKAINPPVWASIVAVPLALIPGINEYVISGSGSVLKKNIFQAMTLFGATSSPLISFLLGSNLSHGYPPSADIKK